MPVLPTTLPLTERQFNVLIGRGRATNRARDRDDRHAGWASPTDTPPSEAMWTAIIAMKAGVLTGDLSCLGEAIAMLEDTTERMRQLEKAPGGPWSEWWNKHRIHGEPIARLDLSF